MPEAKDLEPAMVEVRTNELTCAALDWAIAQIEGVTVAIASPHYGTDWRIYKPRFGGKYSPSTDWAFGGPLIQKYGCHLNHILATNCWHAHCWDGRIPGPAPRETPLIAACLAIVSAKLGNTVQVPAELSSTTTE
jgi:hypothetical protein